MRPWLIRFERASNRQLLNPVEKGRFFCKFTIEGLLRGDILSRYQAYSIGRNWGWLSADDVRETEDMNPLPDGQGETYMAPANMLPASEFESQRPRTDRQQTPAPPAS
jgi:phage portal protein BeeE